MDSVDGFNSTGVWKGGVERLSLLLGQHMNNILLRTSLLMENSSSMRVL